MAPLFLRVAAAGPSKNYLEKLKQAGGEARPATNEEVLPLRGLGGMHRTQLASCGSILALQAADGGVAHAEGASDGSVCLARVTPCDGLTLLVRRQLARPAYVQDMQAQLEKLREQAAELDSIASRATDAAKKELSQGLPSTPSCSRPRWKRPSRKWPRERSVHFWTRYPYGRNGA